MRTAFNQDGAAILDTERGVISTLNPTGAYIWKALQDGMSADEVILSLVQGTGEPVEMIERDVHEFLEALKGKGLL
jgi:hypothetical protein